eukprot:832249-Pyramimonas_sp.AAC.1
MMSSAGEQVDTASPRLARLPEVWHLLRSTSPALGSAGKRRPFPFLPARAHPDPRPWALCGMARRLAMAVLLVLLGGLVAVTGRRVGAMHRTPS